MLKSQTSKKPKNVKRVKQKANRAKCVRPELSAESAIIVCVSQPYPIFKSHLACGGRGISKKCLTKKGERERESGRRRKHFLARPGKSSCWLLEKRELGLPRDAIVSPCHACRFTPAQSHRTHTLRYSSHTQILTRMERTHICHEFHLVRTCVR